MSIKKEKCVSVIFIFKMIEPSKDEILNENGLTREEELKYKKKLALEKLDNADFGWFHIKACLVSGIGFFTDAYDLFIM